VLVMLLLLVGSTVIIGWGNKVSADQEVTLKGTAATTVEAVNDASRQLPK